MGRLLAWCAGRLRRAGLSVWLPVLVVTVTATVTVHPTPSQTASTACGDDTFSPLDGSCSVGSPNASISATLALLAPSQVVTMCSPADMLASFPGGSSSMIGATCCGVFAALSASTATAVPIGPQATSAHTRILIIVVISAWL